MIYYERNLPHWQPPGKDIFITWRLYGSLPVNLKAPSREDSAGKRFRTYDHVLDLAGSGPLWLSDPRIAECMIAALKKAEMQEMFQLHAYVVMANHVHVLVEPKFPIPRITRVIKGSTAREANSILGRTGLRFWQEESFDHWIRNAPEWDRVRTYIERNPVIAGLVQKPEEWRWSSAAQSK
jgi:REP element-mobilizing transposase RayT